MCICFDSSNFHYSCRMKFFDANIIIYSYLLKLLQWILLIHRVLTLSLTRKWKLSHTLDALKTIQHNQLNRNTNHDKSRKVFWTVFLLVVLLRSCAELHMGPIHIFILHNVCYIVISRIQHLKSDCIAQSKTWP